MAGKCTVFEGNLEHWIVPKNLNERLTSATSLRDCLHLAGDRGINQVLTLSYTEVRDASVITFFIMDGNVVRTTEKNK